MSIFKDRTLLITGGTGSFGNAVLRRFLHSDIREIRIFSRDEKKQDDMRHALQDPKVKFYIGDDPDYSEEFICDSCMSKLKINLKMSFDVEVEKEIDFDEEYETKINKPKKQKMSVSGYRRIAV